VKTYQRRESEAEEGTKVCVGCDRDLPLSDYDASATRGVLRHRMRCRDCAERERERNFLQRRRAMVARAEASPLRCSDCGGLPTDRDLSQPWIAGEGHYTRYGDRLLCSTCHDAQWDDEALDSTIAWVALLDYGDVVPVLSDYRLFTSEEMERWNRNLQALEERCQHHLTCDAMMQ